MSGGWWNSGRLAAWLLLGGLPVAAQTTGPAIESRAALLVDARTGQVLYARNADARHAPASTIKLLTALLVWERTGLNGSVRVRPEDTRVEPSHVPLRAGEVVTVGELTRALLIGSDNDSALALARHTAGSVDAFVALMNERARQLGCGGTIVKNPHGLPAKGQYTTAADMLKIFAAALAVPALRDICMTPRHQLTTAAGTQTVKNHNKLLGAYAGMGPAKTGWTTSSRHTYAASATRDGRELRLIILNSPNKWDDARALLDYGFGVSPSAPAPAPLAAAVRQPLSPSPATGRLTLAHPPPPVTSPAANKALTAYKVKKGDTLSAICRRFDVSMKTVLRHNNLPDPHKINPGLVLYIPLRG
ncbi:MAG: LysM peptidoglycan-binding domain-containing protein [Verrucomicrobiales bacterium]|jgi:D-alanyl-D-alanine carboxypeptidase|nr:LysM peptidoglycan-binding domain-containing protein [Verrucomicrobiales bacterium]